MFIKIDGNLIKELEKFTSKLKTRPILQAISITARDRDLEFAATDGIKLYVFTRQADEDEVLAGQLVIKIPKVKGKYTYYLEKNNDMWVLRNPLTEEKVICDEITELNYPNYNQIIPAVLEQLPHAQSYTAFKSENLAALEFVLPEAIAYLPRTNGANNPCFWRIQKPLGTKLVCLMPYRLAETEAI